LLPLAVVDNVILATRTAAIAHQYGVIDFRRIFAIASQELEDLARFCQQLVDRASR
jgi:hypothetical protein